MSTTRRNSRSLRPVAGLLAAGLASAQTSPTTGTAPAGEATTQNRAGEPNPTQRPSGDMPNSRSEVKSEARAQNHMPNNTTTPSGEASIMRNGQPNPPPAPKTSGTTRSEVRAQTRQSQNSNRQLKGQAAAGGGPSSNVPTNPESGRGTPQ